MPQIYDKKTLCLYNVKRFYEPLLQKQFCMCKSSTTITIACATTASILKSTSLCADFNPVKPDHHGSSYINVLIWSHCGRFPFYWHEPSRRLTCWICTYQQLLLPLLNSAKQHSHSSNCNGNASSSRHLLLYWGKQQCQRWIPCDTRGHRICVLAIRSWSSYNRTSSTGSTCSRTSSPDYWSAYRTKCWYLLWQRLQGGKELSACTLFYCIHQFQMYSSYITVIWRHLQKVIAPKSASINENCLQHSHCVFIIVLMMQTSNDWLIML